MTAYVMLALLICLAALLMMNQFAEHCLVMIEIGTSLPWELVAQLWPHSHYPMTYFFPSLKLVSGVNDCSTFDEEEEGDIIDFDFVEDGNGNYTVSAQELDAGEYALVVDGVSSVSKCGKSPYFLELKLSA